MSDSTNHGVVGQDGTVPIYDPKARWCIWALHEVYRGAEGASTTTGKPLYVPKLKDYVRDVNNYTTYIVDVLDPVTLVPTLREIRPANMSFILSESDVLFGVGPGRQAEMMRAYLNTTSIPYTLSVDQLLRVGGSMTAYAKIFKGGDVSGQGEVVSKMYDAAGNFVSENVPLEKVEIDNHTNYAWKVVQQCYCTHALMDNEVLTIVFYSSNGVPVSKSQVLVENTSYIRNLNVSKKYITHIALESPFLASGNDFQIDYPLNVPKNSVNLEGVVYYSNGSTKRYPVNNNKFSLLGYDQFLSTIVGQKLDLVLRYTLDADEIAFANHSVQDKYITQPYQLNVVNPNNSYTVKLFSYPFWDDGVQGYILRWWMLNLDRNFFVEVTGMVNFDASLGAYDPTLFGTVQRKQVSINLRNVSGAFKPFVHTQLIEVSLFARPEEWSTPWLISNEAVHTHVSYGHDLIAKKTGASQINISADIQTKEEWLQRVYLMTYPLVNPTIEFNAPSPTHFSLGIDGSWMDFPLSDWDKDLSTTVGVTKGRTVLIKLIKSTSTGDLTLSLAAMLIRE